MIEFGSLKPSNSYTYSVPELGAHYAICQSLLTTCDLCQWQAINADMTEIARDFIARGLVEKIQPRQDRDSAPAETSEPVVFSVQVCDPRSYAWNQIASGVSHGRAADIAAYFIGGGFDAKIA